jgi:hypothetical protein
MKGLGSLQFEAIFAMRNTLMHGLTYHLKGLLADSESVMLASMAGARWERGSDGPAGDRDQRGGYFVDGCGAGGVAAGLVKVIPFAVISDSSSATVSGNGSRDA